MKMKKAFKVLKKHNLWRKHGEGVFPDIPYSRDELLKAQDTIILFLEDIEKVIGMQELRYGLDGVDFGPLETKPLRMETVIETLYSHNRWRRDNTSPIPVPQPYTPTELGLVIDRAVEVLSILDPIYGLDRLTAAAEKIVR